MESCVLDPIEFIPERVELDLDSLGLAVRAEGVDWGEGAIAAQMVRQAEGESSSDGHRGGVQIRIPIRVMEEGAVSLAEAAHKLQQKVGTWQDRGGWARRDFAEEGGFAGSLGYQIIRHTAALSGLQGWLFAHRRDAPDVVLTAMRMPIGYPTEEDEHGPFTTAAGARHLDYTLPANSGSARGLKRVRFTNEGEEDLRGLIWAEECHDAPDDLEDPTAQLHYLAKDLTPKGGAEVKTVEGAEVVEHSGLTAGWLTILEGEMTHRGPRRMWMRVNDPGVEAGNVQLHLLWRPLGNNRWVEGLPIVPTYVVGDYSLVDLGECRPELAVLGEERWEFRLRARAVSGAGAIRVRDVYPLPTEQYLKVSEPYQPPQADLQSTKSAGAGTGNTKLVLTYSGGFGPPVEKESTKSWSNAANIKTSDNSRATISLSAGEHSDYLISSSHAFGLPEGATVLGIVASVERSQETVNAMGDASVRLVKAGVVVGDDKKSTTTWPQSDAVRVYGGSNDLWGTTWTPADINASGFGLALSVFAANGNVARVDHISLTVYYTEEGSEDRVCYASRSVELCSHGVYRQHREADVWGRLVPDGFSPYTTPGGLEGRPARGILIPTQGDFQALPDSGTPNPASTVVLEWRGYHFAREAGS